MKVQFKITDERFFNNGRIILNSMKDVESGFKNAFSQKAEVKTTIRKPKNRAQYEGIKADNLNKVLRSLLSEESFDIGGETINGETHVENGVFYHKTKEGFDFSIYDKEYNLMRMYNYYQGSVGIMDGQEKMVEMYKKVGYKKSEWKGKISAIQKEVNPHTDLIREKKLLTIAGEIQFGNWALVYRDLFRLLNADTNPGIDLYIYVSADDSLSALLSDNTVSYKSANRVIEENLAVVKTPIWSIALGVEEL